MLVNKCEILLDETNPNRIYYGGQTIVGQVLITFNDETKVKAIHITIKGRAECQWAYRIGKRKQRCTGQETCLLSRTYFIGTEANSQQSITITRGLHAYNFSSVLPESIPSSFEGKYGHIRYIAVVTIEMTNESNKIAEIMFTVIKTVNLNQSIEVKNPIFLERTRKFCTFFCCFTSDSLNIMAEILQGGYVSGQKLAIKLIVNNKSNKEVQQFTIGFYKMITYTDDMFNHRQKKELTKLIDVHAEGCSKNSRKEQQIIINLPVMIPTDVTSCNVCRISYSLKITAEVAGLNNNLVMLIPITIGTIPLEENENEISPDSASISGETQDPPAYDDVVAKSLTQGNIIISSRNVKE